MLGIAAQWLIQTCKKFITNTAKHKYWEESMNIVLSSLLRWHGRMEITLSYMSSRAQWVPPCWAVGHSSTVGHQAAPRSLTHVLTCLVTWLQSLAPIRWLRIQAHLALLVAMGNSLDGHTNDMPGLLRDSVEQQLGKQTCGKKVTCFSPMWSTAFVSFYVVDNVNDFNSCKNG